MDNFQAVFTASELAVNAARSIELNGIKVLVCNAKGEFYAVENQCTHQAAELEGGRIRNCYISCPLHGVRFNLQTGEPMGTLTRVPVKTFPVRLNGDMLEVAVD